MSKNKALVVIDFSYFMYYTAFGAVSEFQKKAKDEAKYWIKPAKETDQKNLPNLLNSDTFKRILKKFVMKRCETLDWQLKGHFQNELDCVDKIDFLFAMDDFTKSNFRKALYPGYKAHRKFVEKQFDMFKIQNYIFNVIFKELNLEEKFGYKFVAVEGAEADDIIAIIVKKCSDNYSFKVLFASDHDFIQLEGVKQINLFGQAIECKVGKEKVTPQEYLLSKILLGDSSDNIPKVFDGIGPKKVMKLVKDKNVLREMLKENQDAAHQFKLNKQLISFNEIPAELTEKIIEKVNVALYENETLNDAKTFGNLEWL